MCSRQSTEIWGPSFGNGPGGGLGHPVNLKKPTPAGAGGRGVGRGLGGAGGGVGEQHLSKHTSTQASCTVVSWRQMSLQAERDPPGQSNGLGVGVGATGVH